MEHIAWPAETAARRIGYRRDQSRRHVFGETEYNSGDGMQTAIFGPVFWTAIHLVSFNYPVNPSADERIAYEEWLRATGRVLPCRHCRDNFAKNFTAAWTDDAMTDRASFSKFCYRLHDEVNRMLGKCTNQTYEEVRDIYEGFRARCLTPAEAQAFRQNNREAGCVSERYAGTKGKCVLRVVPRDTACGTLEVSDNCRVSLR